MTKLIIDGIGGKLTVARLQQFLGVKQTSDITVKKALYKYCPAFTAVEFGTDGSVTVTYLQKWLGINADGHWGAQTSKTLQKRLGVDQDSIFGTNSMKALQKYLNEHDKAVYLKKTIIDKELDACKVQADWMKNYTYTWSKWKPRNIEMSKKYGTCVTYVACVLQRIGVLKSGEYIWHNTNGKVYGNNSKMSVSYPSGTIKGNKSKFKAGDILMVGDKHDTGEGGNSHILILSGKWDSKGNPYIWDNGSCARVKKGNSGLHTYLGSKNVVALVRLKTK